MEIVAAGAVVVRAGEVLLVHRPKYDDWAFPKGKQDPGEHVTTTAAREVLEETGVEIRLGRPLADQEYTLPNGRLKRVHYWVARVLGDHDVSGYPGNDEIDAVAWLPVAAARDRLTYAADVAVLDLLGNAPDKTRALVVLRHARARKRHRWAGEDVLRPLTRAGAEQALLLVPVLAAYGVTRVVSSDAVRCAQTVAPYAGEYVLPLEGEAGLGEEGATRGSVAGVLDALLADKENAVVCSHRPVLPWIFEHLGLDPEPLAPAELVVCHHAKGEIVAVERHGVG